MKLLLIGLCALTTVAVFVIGIAALWLESDKWGQTSVALALFALVIGCAASFAPKGRQ